MIIRSFVAPALGDSSYLIASGAEAAVVDPQRDVRPYLAAAEELGATLRYAVETHVHNDYVSGGAELAALGATIVAPEGSGLQFAHRPVADAEEVPVGRARLRAVRAPGHTHHHMAYLAVDEDGAVAAAFTGGSLLMGGAGRTDLLGPEETEELTRLQWETGHRLASLLPDRAELFPTHGAGSFCTAQPGDDARSARLAEERARNIVLTSPDFDSFRVLHLANPAPMPAYYRHMAPINRAGPRVYGAPPLPARLTPGVVQAELQRGTHVVDVRSRFRFAEGHVPGSLSIEEGTATLAYVSWVTPFDSTLVLVTEDGDQAERLTADLLSIGYEQVRGYLPFDAWRTEAPIERLDTVSVEEAVRIHREGSLPVYDARFDSDRHDLALPGSRAHGIDCLQSWLPGVEDNEPLVVCAGGSRAATVASVLRSHGRRPRVLLEGGAADLVGAGSAPAR